MASGRRRAIVGLLFCGLVAASAAADEAWRYFGQPLPGATPVPFAPDRISLDDRHEFGSVFSADGRAFYLGVDRGERNEILESRFVDGAWTPLVPVVHHEVYGYNDPFLTPDEERLWFISNQPLEGQEPKDDLDLWYVERRGEGWSKPIHGGTPLNSPRQDFYVSFTDEGDLYFSSARAQDDERWWDLDLYVARVTADGFATPVALPETVNTQWYEGDVFVAPDESYLVFVSSRHKGSQGDLYVSFREGDGWSAAVPFGPSINTTGHELCPFVSRDGRALFFTRDGDIHWVDAGIIDDLR